MHAPEYKKLFVGKGEFGLGFNWPALYRATFIIIVGVEFQGFIGPRSTEDSHITADLKWIAAIEYLYTDIIVTG